jgi:hypothetical protein
MRELSNFDKAMILVAEKEEAQRAEAFYKRLESNSSPTYLEDLGKALSRFVIKEKD